MKFNYKNKLNYFFACIASISFYSFFNYEVLSAVAIGIFTYWLSSLFIRVNYSLPIKELFLTMYALQFLFGPALAYNGLDEYTNETFRMKVSSEEYFSFIIPVYFAFAIGFNVYCKKYSLKISRQNINQWVVQNPKTPYIFIGIGFLASLISTILPSSLAFVFYLLGSFKYIGLFVLLLSFQTLKLKLMLVIYGLILISSFQGVCFTICLLGSLYCV